MRRFAVAFSAALMLFAAGAHGADMELTYDGSVHSYSADDIYLEVNGKRVATKEMPPIMIMNRTMVPVREVFEAMGGKVGWNADTKQVTVSYDGIEVAMTPGSREVYLGRSRIVISDGEPTPMIINNKTMVPIRMVADMLGFSVGWDGDRRIVSLNSTDEGFSDSEPVTPEPPSGKADKGVISEIEVEKSGSAELVYLVYGNPVKPGIERYSNSERVVLDFAGAQLGEGVYNLSYGGSIITGVRGANHDDKARIVLDVKSQPNIEISPTENGLVIVATPAGKNYTTKVNDLQSGQTFDPADIPDTTDEIEGSDDDLSLDTDGLVDTTNNIAFDYNTVVIDAGHGGNTGASRNGVQEDKITLAIALKVRDKLEDAGYNVVMTREKDVRVELQTRVDIASKPTDGKKIPAIFVSVHCNSFEESLAVNGTQVYYHPDSKYGTILAENIYNSDVAVTDLKGANVHDGSTLFVIRKTLQPAALVETGFLTNDGDRAYLTSEDGQDDFAEGITQGIIRTMEKMKADKGID